MARNRGEKEPEKYVGLLKLVQILSFLVVFVAGIIIGLATSSHMNQYFTSPSLVRSTNHFAALTFENNNCTNIQTCERTDYLDFENYFRPDNLTHKMSDEQLFWRASMVPSKDEYPFARTPKLAFMFLTRGPLPMLPLWERIFQGHENYFSIYVHALPGYKLNVSKDSPFNGRQIPSQSHDDPSRYGRGRYNRRMRPDIQICDWRKGSQWFEMHRQVAIYIVSDTKYLTVFRKYCKPACYPDEHYIPTYLNIFHGSLMANRSVTWVDWSMRGPHPAVYRKEDITEDFIQSIGSNNGSLCLYNQHRTTRCYLFARKFAANALEPLLNISSKVMDF